ncbi:MAG: class I SAM-dependent methyltransferase [Methanomicrobiales archaeon]|nr:class I SAM-dependent methyltransferase [Methanomicrobiales archaeon]
MESLSDDSLASVWNKRSDTFIRNTGGEHRQKRASDLFGLLEEAGFSPDGARVLDIGCGPGTHALPLARAGADVTALDISQAMLDRVRATAADEGLTIRTQVCSWWLADIDQLGFRGKFDLVIASMTPGVRDRPTFDKMTACSKGYCFYSNFIHKQGDRMLPDIYTQILLEPPRTNAHGPSFVYPFMYLYSQGIFPVVKIGRPTENGDRNWQDEAQKTIDFLGSTRNFSEEIKEKIRNYYQEAEKDGLNESGPKTFIGMMAWKVGDQ